MYFHVKVKMCMFTQKYNNLLKNKDSVNNLKCAVPSHKLPVSYLLSPPCTLLFP